VFAEPIVEVLYSSKFIDSAFFLRILSAYGMFTSIESISSTLLISYGKTNIAFYMTIVRAVLSVISVCIASFFTIDAVAYGLVFVSFLCYFVYWRFAVKTTIDLCLVNYVKAILHPLMYSILASIPFFILLKICDMPVFVELGLIVVFASVYFGVFYLIDTAYLKSIMSMVLRRKE
jgi:O-antigen/teichoic acid export membrane protein